MPTRSIALLVVASTVTAQQLPSYQPDPSHRGDPHWDKPYEYWCSPAHTNDLPKCYRVVGRMIAENKGTLPTAQELKDWDKKFRKLMKEP